MADSEALRLFMEFLNNNGGGARPNPAAGGRTVNAPPRPPSGAGIDPGMGSGEPGILGDTGLYTGGEDETGVPSARPSGGSSEFNFGGTNVLSDRYQQNSGGPRLPMASRPATIGPAKPRPAYLPPTPPSLDENTEMDALTGALMGRNSSLPMPGGTPPGQVSARPPLVMPPGQAPPPPPGSAPQLSNMGGGPPAGGTTPGGAPGAPAGGPVQGPKNWRPIAAGPRPMERGGAHQFVPGGPVWDQTQPGVTAAPSGDFISNGGGAEVPGRRRPNIPISSPDLPSGEGRPESNPMPSRGGPRPGGAPRSGGEEVWKTYEKATGNKWKGGGSDQIQQLVRQLQIGGKAGSAEQNLALQKALRDPAVMQALRERLLGAATQTAPGGVPAEAAPPAAPPPGGAPQGLTPEEWLALQGSSR